MWDITTIIILSILLIGVVLYYFVFKQDDSSVENVKPDTNQENSSSESLDSNSKEKNTKQQRVDPLLHTSIVDGAIPDNKTKPAPKVTKQNMDEFEQFIMGKIKASAQMTLLDWQAYKAISAPTEESGKRPNIYIEWKRDSLNFKFAVECQFETSLKNDSVVYSTSKHGEYTLFSETNKLPIFVAIGLAGTPSSPKTLYFVPLQVLQKGSIHISLLAPYRMNEVSGELTYDYKNMRLRQAPKPVPKQPGA